MCTPIKIYYYNLKILMLLPFIQTPEAAPGHLTQNLVPHSLQLSHVSPHDFNLPVCLSTTQRL